MEVLQPVQRLYMGAGTPYIDISVEGQPTLIRKKKNYLSIVNSVPSINQTSDIRGTQESSYTTISCVFLRHEAAFSR